ncbi:MAG: NAD(P)/FAD-dependent oxidoreductase [Anaerovoracaceae bacterium]
MNLYDVAVIGAGASGMMAALGAGELGASVLLLDGNEKEGKKLYATGNGRCNLTNSRIEGSEEIRRRFESLGLLIREEDEGRCYPYSGQAASLVAVLCRGLDRHGVRRMLGDRVTALEKEDGCFVLHRESGEDCRARKVIVAAGGRAGLKFGSTGDGYGFARAFGHTLTPPRPGLVAAESEDPHMAELKGVRARGSVQLELEGKVIAREAGELQFTGTGISGICVFNLSRHMDAPRPAGKNKKKKKRADGKDARKEASEKHYCIAADLAPDLSEKELLQFEMTAAEGLGYTGEGPADPRLLAQVLSGMINSRLAEVISRRAAAGAADGREMARAAALIKRFPVNVSHTKGWEEAQVTVGGVRMEEIHPETMESKLASGLYFCGEVLDFDGPCGGYNLQWAWESGLRAGACAAGAARGRAEADRL